MKTITTSALRADIYKILDEVLETGVAVQIDRKGRKLKIVAEQELSNVARFTVANDLVIGDTQEIADIGWENEWSAEI
jgi:hypothetical protein